MSPRSKRILSAIVFAVLWSAGMLWWASSIDMQTVGTAVVAGAIAGLLVYWLFNRFGARLGS